MVERQNRKSSISLFICRIISILAGFLFFSTPAFSGNQRYEALSDSVRTALSASISDRSPVSSSFDSFDNAAHRAQWLSEMALRLEKRMPDLSSRLEFLKTVHYEATRAGLDPELVLGLIQVESGFRKYAVSVAGARGYMQVMPFWIDVIGGENDNLFHLRTNLRYGCVILRHYLDIEKGNLFRALGRYNGSLGRAEYPNAVFAAWQQWTFNP